MTDGQPSDEVQPAGQSSYPDKGKSTATFNVPLSAYFVGLNVGFAFLSFDPNDLSTVHTVSASAHTKIN